MHVPILWTRVGDGLSFDAQPVPANAVYFAARIAGSILIFVTTFHRIKIERPFAAIISFSDIPFFVVVQVVVAQHDAMNASIPPTTHTTLARVCVVDRLAKCFYRQGTPFIDAQLRNGTFEIQSTIRIPRHQSFSKPSMDLLSFNVALIVLQPVVFLRVGA